MPHTPDQPPRFPSDRSERAKAMVKAGLFGGAGRGQGRKPRNRTAGAEVADLAAREASSIKKVYSAGLRSKNERTRLMAAKDLLAEERRELDRHEAESDLRDMSHAELDRMFIETLVAALDENGKLPLEWRMFLAGEPLHLTVEQIDVFEIALPDWFDTDLEEDGEQSTAEDVVDAEVVEDDPASDIDIEIALAELGVPIEKTENVSAPPRQFGLRAWPRAPAGDS